VEQRYTRESWIMKILLLGSNHISTAESYKQFNLAPSVLVTDAEQEYKVGHTSRQEFSSDTLLELTLSHADIVYWAFPSIEHFTDEEEYYVFMEWLKDYHLTYHNVKNFSDITFDPYNWKMKLPTLTQDDAVFLGCSFTAGESLPGDKSNRYAEIIAKHYNKTCVNLSKSGGSNNRSFEIFSNLDFVDGQIVVFQLTSLERLRYIFDNGTELKDIMIARMNNARPFISMFNKNFLLYELLVKLSFVIQIARLKNLKLIFWLKDYKNDVYTSKEQSYFYDYKEFVPRSMIENYLVDFGDDGSHPGIESNKNIANSIINYMDQIYK
jgi:hypothetical protein